MSIFSEIDRSKEASQYLEECLSKFPRISGESDDERFVLCCMGAISDLFSAIMSRNATPRELVTIVSNTMDITHTAQGSLTEVAYSLNKELDEAADRPAAPPPLIH